MSGGIFASMLLGTVALAFVLVPLFRKDAARAERLAAATSARQELMSQREMVLAALKDLEDDRATDKIDDQDYAQLHARLSSRAVEVMKRLDALEAKAAPQAGPQAVGRPRPARRRRR